MRQTTMTKYKTAIDELITNVAINGVIYQDDFNNVTSKHRITKALPYYLGMLNIIERVGVNKYKFTKTVSINDIKKIGTLQHDANMQRKEKLEKENKNQIKMDITNPQEEDFSAKAIAHLESLGYLIQKKKFDLPISTYHDLMIQVIKDIKSVDDVDAQINKMKVFINGVAEVEERHIKLAFDMGRLYSTKPAIDYIKDEYNPMSK